ncbi:thioredoxin domain-containing protein [Natrialba sp. PRR66]|uniref:DsbA family protein n=1 Tax=Natrialba sp. PRR66 TaxID=3098146 RepID=UPI002B1DF21C|nr:thioredoxin domain-containing protein [Natrialba sp. PRR66]
MRQTRRAILATTAAVGIGGVAGCLGNGGPPDAPVNGDSDADVTVTIYEDFSCHFCQAFKLQVYPELESQYIEPGEIQYEFRDFPVPVNEKWSWEVASAAREVFENEGNDAFWTFASDIYEHLGSYTYDVIEEVADDAGADGGAVREAAENEQHRSVIEDNKSHGDSNDVAGTPTVFVGGEQVEFYESDDFVMMALEQTTTAIENALE